VKLVCLISKDALILGQILNSRSALIMELREYTLSIWIVIEILLIRR
jgi:hypothetical protein